MDIAKLKILVVDDHPAARKMMERILLEIGVTSVDQAADVQEAAQKLDAAPYNALLLDWHLPGSSGYHFLQTCRADRKYDKVAFIIVSAESGPRFVSEAIKAGATSYIVKPFTDKVMRDHINKALIWLDQHNGAPTAETVQQKS
jgi:two-component system chemotaxis response regulator CheY